MADPPPVNETVTSAATKISTAVVSALPPAFLMLVLLNTAFLAFVLWFLNTQLEQRMALLSRVLDGCLLHK